MRGTHYRERVTIQTPTHTTTDGEIATTWSDTADVRAAIEPLSGRELWAAQQAQAQTSYRVRLRYSASYTLSADCRIVWGDVTLRITSPPRRDVLRNTWTLDCMEDES